eukprot:3786476-Alexandrium_andersonii.AAC.1
MQDFMDRQGIRFWIAPGEAHWLMGKTERQVGTFKRVLTKYVTDMDESCTLTEAIATCVKACDEMTHLGKAAPVTAILGRDVPTGIEPELDCENGQTSENRRALARKAFLDAEAAEKLRRI